MSHWLTLSFAAVVFWGLWGFLPTLASKTLDPKAVVVFQAAGTLVVLLAMAGAGMLKLSYEGRGAALSFASGVAGSLGSLAFVYALVRGRPTSVLTITALYPVVSILLAFVVLGEEVTRRKLLSIACAIGAVILASG